VCTDFKIHINYIYMYMCEYAYVYIHTHTFNQLAYSASSPPPRCFCFAMVVRLTRSGDIKNYASSNTATGRVSKAGQVKSEDPDKERHPGPPGLGLGIRLTYQSHKNKFVPKTIQSKSQPHKNV
jgi:hypothetical protein